MGRNRLGDLGVTRKQY